MRISDWSSDVCSSDLVDGYHLAQLHEMLDHLGGLDRHLVSQIGDRDCFRHMHFARDEFGHLDRKSVVSGKSVSVRVDLGGRRIIKKIKKNHSNVCSIE